jgi:hypothetical protein
MSVMTINLKQLVQRRILWLVYAFLTLSGGVYAVALLDALSRGRNTRGWFSGLLMLSAVVGVLVASMQMEMLVKPFAFGLPGHRSVVRRILIRAGITINLLACLLFLAYPGLTAAADAMVVVAAFFSGLTFFWLGVAWVFVGWNAAIMLAMIPAIIFGSGLFNLHILIERVVVGYPFAVIALGIAVTIVAWLQLGREAFLRGYCGQLRLGITDAFDPNKQRQYARQVNAWKKIKPGWQAPRIEGFFRNRMSDCQGVGIGRYLWGQCYATLGPMLMFQSNSYANLVMLLLIVCVFGYIGQGAGMLYFMLSIVLIQAFSPAYSTVLVPGGRRERFWANLTNLIVLTGFVTIFLLGAMALMIPLERVMPDLTIKNHPIPYRALSLQYWYMPLLLMPLGATLYLMFSRRPLVLMVLICCLSPFAMFLTMAPKGSWFQTIPGYSMAALVGLAWMVYGLVCHRVCLKWSLVRT